MRKRGFLSVILNEGVMKKICRNCHFLTKEHRDGSGHVHRFTLNQKERDKSTQNPTEAISEFYSLNCWMGVWDEGVSCTVMDREATINTISRESSCFFFPYHPNMLFSAARELQKRSVEYEELKRSNRYTCIGLWIASAGLLVSAFVGLLAYFSKK